MPRLFRYLPVFTAALLGCGRCGAKVAAQVKVEDLLPMSAPGMLEVPSLSQLASDASALATSLSRFPEGETAGGALNQLAAQLGFDPRTPAGLEAAGIDGTRPAALVFEGTNPVAVLPVSDRGSFEKVVARLAKDRLGAGAGVTTGEVTVYSGGSGVAALGFRGGYALVANGESAAAAVGQALTRTPDQSLAALPLFRTSMNRLGGGSDIEAWAPAGSPLLPAWTLPGRAFVAGLSFHRGRLEARLLSMLSVDEGIGLSGLSLPAGQALLADLAPGSPFVSRIGGEPAMLSGAWARLPAAVRRPVDAAGIDVPNEVLRNLEPGVVVGLGLAPNLDFSAAASFDPRRQNPFRYVTLDAFARVHDPVKGAATLEKIYAAAPKLGATISRRKVGAQAIATFSYDKGEGASVALAGQTLVVTGGQGEMDAALARLAGKSPVYAVPKGLERALRGHVSSGAVLDTDALRAAVAHIPSSAYVGLTGLTMRALVSRFIAPLALVGPIVATVSFDADAAIADAEVTLR
jgi:hypothetical protein